MATGRPLFPGGNTNDQLLHIFRVLGTPNTQSWPAVADLPDWDDNFPQFPAKDLRNVVPDLSDEGYELLDVSCLLVNVVVSWYLVNLTMNMTEMPSI